MSVWWIKSDFRKEIDLCVDMHYSERTVQVEPGFSGLVFFISSEVI